jgi:hypothetical protein
METFKIVIKQRGSIERLNESFLNHDKFYGYTSSVRKKVALLFEN